MDSDSSVEPLQRLDTGQSRIHNWGGLRDEFAPAATPTMLQGVVGPDDAALPLTEEQAARLATLIGETPDSLR